MAVKEAAGGWLAGDWTVSVRVVVAVAPPLSVTRSPTVDASRRSRSVRVVVGVVPVSVS